MRPKTLLVLLLLVVGLGAFIWFFERDLPGSDERAQQAKRVLSIESEEVIEFMIERGDVRVRLTRPEPREEGAESVDEAASEATPAKREWRLVEPYSARADTAAADRLADTLSLLEKERTLEDVDAAAVGLDQPRARVTLRTSESESTLEVGAEIPASSNMVLALDSETFIVPAAVWDMISREPGEWRSPDLFPLHRGAVERVELGGGVGLALRDDDTFWIEAPFEDRADKTRVDELLNAMFRMEIASYLDQPAQSAAEMGLEPATQSISAEFVGLDQPYKVELGAPTPDGTGERFARIEGQVMTVGGDLDEALSREPSEWQQVSWTGLEVFEVDSFRVLDGSGEMLLERAGSDWARDGEAIGYSPVSDFLYALTGVSGTRVVDRSEAEELGADLAAVDLEIQLKGSKREESLRLHDAEAGALGGSEGRQFWLLLSEGAVEDLRVKLQGIRDEAPLSEEPDAEG